MIDTRLKKDRDIIVRVTVPTLADIEEHTADIIVKLGVNDT